MHNLCSRHPRLSEHRRILYMDARHTRTSPKPPHREQGCGCAKSYTPQPPPHHSHVSATSPSGPPPSPPIRRLAPHSTPGETAAPHRTPLPENNHLRRQRHLDHHPPWPPTLEHTPQPPPRMPNTGPRHTLRNPLIPRTRLHHPTKLVTNTQLTLSIAAHNLGAPPTSSTTTKT